MWTTIISTALPVLFKLLGWFLDSINAKKETKRKFIKWVEESQKKYNISVKLNKDYRKLMDEFKNEIQNPKP